MDEQRTTPEQLAEGHRLLAAASPGRWYAEHERDGEWTINADHWPDVDDADAAICLGTFWMCGEHDARATAWLRNAAPALLSDADALTGALKEMARLRAVLEEIIDLPTTPVSGLGGVDKSIIGMAVKAGRLEAAAVAARALMPGTRVSE